VRRFVFSIGLFWLGACGGPGSGPDPDMRSPVTAVTPGAPLTLGTSDAMGGFVPYTDGQDVTLVEGAQGGFHVWMRYEYGGKSGISARLERTAHRRLDGAIVLRSVGDANMVPESDPLPMFMCPSPVGLSVIDQPIQFQLRFTDDAGAELATGAITLVPHCPDDNRDFCLRICTG
jgi:hypothetical protein